MGVIGMEREERLLSCPVIILASSDNVGVVIANARPGRKIEAGGMAITVKDAIPFGHKIALSRIAADDVIVKFGVAIGQAKEAIEPGEHVHVHNIKSIYINNAVDHYERR